MQAIKYEDCNENYEDVRTKGCCEDMRTVMEDMKTGSGCERYEDCNGGYKGMNTVILVMKM